MTDKLSLFTIEILSRLQQQGLEWLARDEDGYLQAFRLEPFMWSPEDQYFEIPVELVEEPDIEKDYFPLTFVEDCFKMIKPKEKCKITHLLGV